ncbi:uncharacterized protein LOC114945560 [Nylanderia fulva]|uniref:uncharacterized protein LOC114945560 n=1 Tax=Nylanderia fulva TaxID=613905 RepID=UPI0010FB5775|nr:uncharacterized protein LOC114945560 [Nylanderia fulva]
MSDKLTETKIEAKTEEREAAQSNVQTASDTSAPARILVQQVLQDWLPDGEPWTLPPTNQEVNMEPTTAQLIYGESYSHDPDNFRRRTSRSSDRYDPEREARSDTEPMEDPQTPVVNSCKGNEKSVVVPEQIVIDVFPQHSLCGEDSNISGISNPIIGTGEDNNPPQREMDLDMDNASVASSSAQILGKRKKARRDSDTDDPSPQIRRRSSRTSKAPCLGSDEESSNKRITRSTHAANRNEVLINTDSEPQSQSCSEAEANAKKPSKKPARRMRSIGEPTIEQRLRPLPLNVEELYSAPISEVRASAIEWLNDIDTIRINSNYQGALSGQIRKRVNVIKEILRVLGEKIEDTGDPSYLRRRNSELAAELAASKRETAKLRRDVQDLQKIVGDLKKAIDGGRFVEKAEKATSPFENPRKDAKSKSRERRDTRGNANAYMDTQNADVVMRPPIKGVSKPIPAVETSTLRDLHDEDAELSRRIAELASQRKLLRQSFQKQGKENPATGPVPAGTPQDAAKNKPRVISNTQIVAPKETRTQNPQTVAQFNDPAAGPSQRSDAWQKVESKKDKRLRKKEAKQAALNSQKANNVKPNNNGNNGEVKRRRPPRTAAVAIKGVTNDFSYAAALKKLREVISLSDLNIDKSSIRHSASGGIVIEVPGKDKAEKTEALREKVSIVLGESATVTRPVVKGEMRLIGLDDSVVPDEVADVIATAGDCKAEEVKVGTIRPMTNGLFTVWAQCPLAAAIKATQKGKIRIGWTVARIDLLKARPTQCYKCWGHGHLRNKCTATVDRSQTCFRCGGENHPALKCQNPIRCILCVEQGKDPNHRVGSNQCKANFKAQPNPITAEDPDRRPVAMEIGNEVSNSPISREEFLTFLDELSVAIRILGGRTLICGDFNAKSSQWGSRNTDRRDELVDEWAAEHDLRLINSGALPTCIRPQDDGYLNVNDRSSNSQKYPRWNIKKMDIDKFRAAILWNCTNSDDQPTEKTAEDQAKWIERSIHQACDTQRRPIATRRAWSHAKQRRRPLEILTPLRDRYKVARKALKSEISKAKYIAWQDLIQTIEDDPWGLPYKVVLKKLRRSSPSLTETLNEDTVNTLLESLFPSGVETDPNELWPNWQWPEETAEEYNITAKEVFTTIKRKAGNNTARDRTGSKQGY